MANEKVMDILEETMDTIEDTLDTIERIPRGRLNGTTRKQQVIIITTCLIAGAAVGGTVAYLVTKKRMTLKYEKIIEEEVAAARNYTVLPEKPDLGRVAEEKAQLHRDRMVYQGMANQLGYGYTGADPEQESTEAPEAVVVATRVEETVEVFTTPEGVVAPQRDPAFPYLISTEEFLLNEPENEQVTLTYYAGDDVLADEREQPIRETDTSVGDDNLTMFGTPGSLSDDPNVIHVRNERSEVDFEIVKSEGKFSEEVLGFLEHSDRRGGRLREHQQKGQARFRADDG